MAEFLFGGSKTSILSSTAMSNTIAKIRFLPKSFRQNQNATREKLCEALMYEKRDRELLMKLTRSVESDSFSIKTWHLKMECGYLRIHLATNVASNGILLDTADLVHSNFGLQFLVPIDPF